MNKLILPTILMVVIVSAGIFVFVDIEKVSSVHTSIQGSQLNEAGARSANQFSNDLAANSITVTSTRDFVVYCTVSENGVGNGSYRITDGTDIETFSVLGDTSASFAWAANAGETVTLDSPVQAYDGLCTAMTITNGQITFG